MTPSSWGDDAQTRDAGHDEMQAAEFRRWQGMVEAGLTIKRQGRFAELEFVAVGVDVEFPFIAAGRLIGFADVAVKFLQVEDEKTNRTGRLDWWFYLEVKPQIYSVGAVIRQCKATEINHWRACPRGRDGREHGRFDVFAVVYEDDPKASLLAELYPHVVPLKREVALECAA